MPLEPNTLQKLDPWSRLRPSTPARIGLGRVGDAVALCHMLDLQLCHARARDTVHVPMDATRIEAALAPIRTISVKSQAPDRPTYLRRPDLGRRLDEGTRKTLPPGPFDVVFVIGDGLSSTAADQHAAPFLKTLFGKLENWTFAPVVLAEQARVALADDIGQAVRATLSVMLIGERPGLTASDSLGVYVTYEPRPSRRDSERNCISNIHAGGLSYSEAANQLCWLLTEARARRISGVALKADRLIVSR